MGRIAIIEIAWYTRQLKNMGRGADLKPNEHALKVFLLTVIASTRRVQRLRESAG